MVCVIKGGAVTLARGSGVAGIDVASSVGKSGTALATSVGKGLNGLTGNGDGSGIVEHATISSDMSEMLANTCLTVICI
jgi:hypothetical protein